MNYHLLYNFISPVTGRIKCDRGYILEGDDDGIATPSPILIDMQLDFINMRQHYDFLTTAKFIVGSPNKEVPKAQSLSDLESGLLKNTVNNSVGTLSKAIAGKDYIDLAAPIADMKLALIRPLQQDEQEVDISKLLARVDRLPEDNMPDLPFIMQKPSSKIPSAQGLSDLGGGILKSAALTGEVSIASGGKTPLSDDYVRPLDLEEEILETKAFASAEAAAAEAAAIAASTAYFTYEMLPYVPSPVPLTGVGFQISAAIGVAAAAAASAKSTADDANTRIDTLTLSGELEALAAFTATGIMVRTAVNTYAGRTITVGTGLGITNGNGVLGNPSLALSTQLQNLNNLNSLGFVSVSTTGVGTSSFVTRNITVGTGLGITNDNGVSGNPTIALSTQLQNLHNLNSLGFVSVSTTGVGTSSFVNRSITAGTGISITNGNGVSGNPTVAVSNVPIAALFGYPANANLFPNGAGTWSAVDINNGTTGSLAINRLAGYVGADEGSFLKSDGYWSLVNISTNTTGSLPISRLSGYPSNANLFSNGAGSWSQVNINNGTTGSLAISRLSGYPSNVNSFLNGSGTWSLVDINTNTTGSLLASRISGYPSNSSLFLNGAGGWSTPSFPNPIITNASSYNFTLNNTNSAATATDFKVLKNGTDGVAFGFNNNANEAYLWAYGTASLKFGTNGIKRMELLNNGTLDLLNNNLITTNTVKVFGIESSVLGNINVYSPISMSGNRIINLPTPSNIKDAVPKEYVDLITETYELSVNTNTGGLYTTNWLRRALNTKTNTQVYGLTSNSFMVEHHNGESAGIGLDGSTDACTIWTAGDNGSLLNIQDEDNANTRVAYVNTSGAWTVVSSQQRKYSIREKKNNDVLSRFMNLTVKTYGYKYPLKETSTKKQQQRIEKKLNKMSTGFILEEVFQIFPNCIPNYYNKLFQGKREKPPTFENEIKDPGNAGIDYNVLLCYFILAFQEFVQKTDTRITEVEDDIGNLKEFIKQYK